jgi:hypothetical protein
MARMGLLGFCQWLETTWVGMGIRESQYVYPALHFVHLLSMSLMFGTILYLDLRLVGLGLTRRRVSDIAEQLLPWTWVGYALMAISGAFIFTSDSVRYYNNPFFRAKLALMVLAGVNALVFHFTIYRTLPDWDLSPGIPARARVAGAISLTTWIAILVAGRAVGYSQ